MTRRFSHNAKMLADIKKAGFFNPVAVAALPLSLLFYIIGLSITKGLLDSYYSEDIFNLINILFWVGIITTIIFSILYATCLSKKDYLKSTSFCISVSACSLADCLIFMFFEDVADTDLKPLFVVFLIIFAALIAGILIYSNIVEKKNQSIVDQLGKCYLELNDNGLCGISFATSDVTAGSSYFEISYEEVRNTRTTSANIQSKQYINLYIDTKFATYNLSIENNLTACNFINRAKVLVSTGMKVELPELEKKVYRNIDATTEPTRIQNYSNEGGWYCPQCGKFNMNYVGTCGCGTQKP